MKKRVAWIDIAKGISIFFIVLGHIYTRIELRWVIYSFHVPIFFFLSGVTAKEEKFSIQTIWNYMKTILIPYFVIALFSIFLFDIFGVKVFYMLGRVPSNYVNLNQNATLIDSFAGMLYGNSKTGNMQWNLPLWFLPCFFAVKILGLSFEKVLEKKYINRILFIGLCVILGIAYAKFLSTVYFPFQMETAVSMLVWYELGRLLSKRIKMLETEQWDSRQKLVGGLFGTAFGIIGISISLHNTSVQCRIDKYGNFAFYYMACTCLIILVLSFSIILYRNKYLEYIGRNSLIILLFHKFPIVLFQLIFKHILDSDNLIVAGISGVIVAIVTIILVLGFNQGLIAVEKELSTKHIKRK